MIISHNVIPNNVDLIMGKNLLKWEEVMHFLGVYIDQGLTFKNHVDQDCKKLSKSIGILYRLSSYVPYDIHRTLYFSLMRYRLSYAITSWGGAGLSHINRVIHLQL